MSLGRMIARMAARIDALERRFETSQHHGTVHEVDTAKSRVRLKLGEVNGEPVIGPWVPYAQVAGAVKAHVPPSVGQQMTAISPSGDPRQAIALPMTFSNENPSPGSSADPVITYGDFTFTLEPDRLTVNGPNVDVKCERAHVEAEEVLVESPSVDLGDDGGKPVARIGDMVSVTFGSSAGLHPIVQGSSKVRAAD